MRARRASPQWTRSPEAPAAHRHHLPRRAPIAAGHARPHLRHAAHRQLRGAPPAPALQPGNVGRRHFRRGHALPARGPVRCACANCARPSPISVSRCCCAPPTPSAIRRTRITWWPSFIYEAVRAGHRHLPHLRFAQLAAEHEGVHGGRAQDALGVRGRHLLHRRHSGPARATSIRSPITSAWRKELERMGAHMLGHQGHGGAVPSLCGRESW